MKKINFDKLTPEQKRVLIMKDVLLQIEAGKYLPSQGLYFIPLDGPSPTNVDQTKVKELGTCFTCALGASILSALRLFNGITLYSQKPGDNYYDTLSGIQKWFSREQADLIETYFECFTNRTVNDYPRTMNMIAFIKKYPTPTERLRAIAKNIIRNKGTFIPTNYSAKVPVSKQK